MAMALKKKSEDIASGEPFMAFAADSESASVLEKVATATNYSVDRIFSGGIPQAITVLKDIDTPKILVIDLDGSDNPEEALGDLADVCDPGTKVITFGSVNDVGFYRHLIDLGVVDYIVKPLAADTLIATLEKLTKPVGPVPVENDRAKLHVVVGTRGGVGASTVAMNLAWYFAEEQGEKCVLMDLDPFFGTSALQLDLEPGHGMRDALETPDRMDELFLARSLTQVSEKLSLLCSEEGLSRPMSLDEVGIFKALDLLGDAVEEVVVDLPRSLVPASQSLLSGADVITLVSDLTLAGLRDALRIKAALKEWGATGEVKVILNRVGFSKTGELPLQTFEKNLEHPVAGQIPYDPDQFCRCLEEGKTILSAGNGKMKKAVELAAKHICGSEEDTKKGIFSKFLKKKGK